MSLERANQLAKYIQELKKQEALASINELPILSQIRKERLEYEKELKQLQVDENNVHPKRSELK